MRFALLDEIAGRQYGLATRGQLTQCGFSRAELDGLIRSGRIVPVRLGVYRLCGAQTSWWSTVLAAVLAAGGGAVLSHRSAGVLWGFLDRHGEDGPVEITATSLCRQTGIATHRHRLGPGETTKRDAIPVTTAERTLLDLSQSCSAPDLSRFCDEGLRRRILTLGRLHRVVEAHNGSGRRRLGPIRAVLADRLPGYNPGANDWEQRMDRMWDRLGLPAAERQYRIRVGRRTFHADRAIVDLKIAVEWHGYDPHGYRGNMDSDSNREALLATVGWHSLHFTSNSRPDLICRSVLAVVAERSARRGRTA